MTVANLVLTAMSAVLSGVAAYTVIQLRIIHYKAERVRRDIEEGDG